MSISDRIREGIYVLLNKTHDRCEILESRRGMMEQRDIKKIWKDYSAEEVDEILSILVISDMIFETTTKGEKSFFVPSYIREDIPPYMNNYYVDKGMNDAYTIDCGFYIEPYFRDFIFNSSKFCTVEDYWKWGVLLSLGNEWIIVIADIKRDLITIFFDKDKSNLLNIVKDKIEKSTQKK